MVGSVHGPTQYGSNQKLLLTKRVLRAFIFTYFPIFNWLPQYSLNKLQCDLIAGITVGMMVVPQGLAYASIARLPNHYGLYSSFIGCFVYTVFGTAKDIAIGPTAILSLLVSTYSIPHCGDMAVLLSFCVGSLLLLMGLLRLGFLVRFVSIPVITAFTTAAAITIACGQLKDLNGIQRSPRDFFGNLEYIFVRVKRWNFYDFGYGTGCLIVLLFMRFLSKLKWDSENLSPRMSACYKCLWLCGIARNALVVIVSCLIVYLLETYHISVSHYITLVDNIESGLPGISVPKFTITFKNTTYHFKDALQKFGSGLVVVPLIAFLEAVAIAKAFGRMNNYKIRPSQELIALGMANLLGSFISAYPVTGSFSRTAVNSQSGVKTPLAGVFTGAVVLLATQFLTRLFQYIPKACLGAIIISAVLPMVEFPMIKLLWQVKKVELLPYLGTLFACFYSLEVGLSVGLVISLFVILYPIYNPCIDVHYREVSIIQLHSALSYPGVEKLTSLIDGIMERQDSPIAIVIDMANVLYVDYTVVSQLEDMMQQVKSKLVGTEFLLVNTRIEVRETLSMTKLNDAIANSADIVEKYGEGRGLLSI